MPDQDWDISKADIWALGVSVIQMLLGQVPASACHVRREQIYLRLLQRADEWR